MSNTTNNQNNGITRKNMIKNLISTNKTKNSGEGYDDEMIRKLIDNYNNYSKKVIHNIISNILNKEDIADYEYDTINIILTTIFENINSNGKQDKYLLYIDTILFIIDKLYLYGSFHNNEYKNNIYLKILDEINNIKENNDYNFFSGIIAYTEFYEQSFQNNLNKTTGYINTSQSATGNNNELTIDDFIKGKIFKINKDKSIYKNNNFIRKAVNKDNSNKIISKLKSIPYFTVELLGLYYKNNNINDIYFIFFENNLKIIVEYSIKQINTFIKNKLIEEENNNISNNNIFNMNKFKKSIAKTKELENKNGDLLIDGMSLYNSLDNLNSSNNSSVESNLI